MPDLTIGHLSTIDAEELDKVRVAFDEIEDNIRCACLVTPSAYDCDGFYIKGGISWHVWQTAGTQPFETAVMEQATEVILTATQAEDHIDLCVFDRNDEDQDIRDVFVTFPLKHTCDVELIKGVLFDNALAQARNVELRHNKDDLRTRLIKATRERIDIVATLKGLGYDMEEDDTH